MKLIIKNQSLTASVTTLKAIDTSVFTGIEMRYVSSTKDVYVFQPNLTDQNAVQPNIGEGVWTLNNKLLKILVTVELDSFNEATNADENISDLDTFIDIGPFLVGKHFGFMDFKSLRDQIKTMSLTLASTDLSNWANLTQKQKDAMLDYCPTYIISLLGLPFFITECSDDQIIANKKITNYIIQTQGDIESGKTGAYRKRWRAVINHFYNYLGKRHGLELSKIAQSEGVYDLYIQFGTLEKAVDEVPGFKDWIYSTETFTTTGCKDYLENLSALDSPDFLLVDPLANPVVKKTGQPLIDAIDSFLNDAIKIVEQGEYV